MVPEAEPTEYLRELLTVELECRAKQGENAHLADYVQRFPEHAATIRAVFAQREPNSGREWSMNQVDTESHDRPDDGAAQTFIPPSGNFSLAMEGIEGLEDSLSAPETPAADNPPLPPGTVIGNYTLLGLISRGAMGTVYKAEHRRMGRTVAIKMISPSALRDAEAVQRFHRETQAMARLEHPNIVTAHDADQVGDIHILVMQYVDGDDLWTTVKNRGPLPLDMALQCLMQTARGMEYAHRAGVVHRDIKPANLVLARNGVVKILDLGLARLEKSLQEDASFNPILTQPGNIMGTADFMAPEQAENATAADQRADVYSLGCTFYFLLTGKTLFGGDTIMKRVMAHRLQPVPLLRADRPDVPEWLEAIFQKMVAKEAHNRYQSMTEVLTDLAPRMASVPLSHEIDESAPDRMSFSETPSPRPPTAVQPAKAAVVQQAPPVVAAQQTVRHTSIDTQVEPVAPERPVYAVQEISASRRRPAGAESRKGIRLLGAATALGLLVSGLLATLAFVIYVATDDGTLVIEAADREVKDALRDKGIRVRNARMGRLLTLQPGRHWLKSGEYEIDVAELPPGIEISSREFHLERGSRATLKVTVVRQVE